MFSHFIYSSSLSSSRLFINSFRYNNSLIKVYCSFGEPLKAVKEFNDMKLRGQIPNSEGYSALISSLITHHNGNSGHVDRIINEMHTNGILASQQAYRDYINFCNTRQKLDDALRIVKILYNNNYYMDSFFIQTIRCYPKLYIKLQTLNILEKEV